MGPQILAKILPKFEDTAISKTVNNFRDMLNEFCAKGGTLDRYMIYARNFRLEKWIIHFNWQDYKSDTKFSL
jgi:hypothetical protein